MTLTFKLFPERTWAVRRHWFKKRYKIDTNLFFLVNIFETEAEYTGHRTMRSHDKAAATSAASFLVPPPGACSKSMLGEINFSRPNLTWETLAHELGHAIAAWLEHKKIRTVEKTDTPHRTMRQEFFCDVQGNLLAQFMDFAVKNEVIVWTLEMTNKGRK
jgi:hypothetical protein